MGYIKEQPSYFLIVYGRGAFKKLIIQLFSAICFPFRIILEVFLRRQMGERYFSGWVCLFWSIFFIGGSVFSFTDRARYVVPEPYLSNLNAIGIFGILFFAFSIWKWLESYQSPLSVSFDRFSKSNGNPLFFFNKLWEKPSKQRIVQIWLEPLLFFSLGAILLLIPGTRILGLFLAFCSIMYSLSYRASYSLARDYILDIIDEKISTSTLGVFVKSGVQGEKSRGFQTIIPYPEEESHKRLLSKLISHADPSGEQSSIAQ